MDYEVAELKWEKGEVVMHGLGPPGVPCYYKPLSTPSPTKYTWDDKPHAAAGGTLESIVNQATTHNIDIGDEGGDDDDLVSWFDDCLPETSMDIVAVVPTSCTNYNQQVPPSTRVASCSGDAEMARVGMGSSFEEISEDFENQEAKNLIGSMVYEGKNNTVSPGETSLGEERVLTTTSTFKHNKRKTLNNHDSRGQESRDNEDEDEKKRSKISSFSTKRCRVAATHNQSERKRRDKINQRLKTLQKLVPTSSKTDTASMLDEVIEYLKQLRAQVKAMSMMIHVNMQPPPMMLPNMAFQQQQQQFQMSMMGMARPIDVNALSSPNITTIPSILHTTAPSNFNNPPIASPGADPLASLVAVRQLSQVQQQK